MRRTMFAVLGAALVLGAQCQNGGIVDGPANLDGDWTLGIPLEGMTIQPLGTVTIAGGQPQKVVLGHPLQAQEIVFDGVEHPIGTAGGSMRASASITLDGNQFTMTWTLISASTTAGGAAQSSTLIQEYTGTISGNVIQGTASSRTEPAGSAPPGPAGQFIMQRAD